MERRQMSNGPLWGLQADPLWDIKHFQDFKKSDYQFKIQSIKHPSLDHNKMERLQMVLLGMLSQTPFGE